MTIKYFLQSKKNPAPIYIRVRGANNIDAKSRTKWNINPIDWSKIKGQPKNLHDSDFKALKNELDNFSSKLSNDINKLSQEDKITSAWLKNYITPKEIQPSLAIPLDVINYIDYYIECKKNEVSKNSIKKWNGVKHKLERMQTKRQEVILIANINEVFKTEFVKYSKNENYSTNTIQRDMVFITTFCKHARYNGIETHYQLDNLKLPKEKTEKIYLTVEELDLIEDCEIESSSLQNARDWLIISCYTGQRVSDFMKFTKKALRVEKEITLIEFTQKKTKKIMGLPLHPKVLEILRKNKGEFPYEISDQNYNIYIKEVCKKAGLTQLTKGSKKEEIEPKSKIYRKISGTFPKYELVTSHIGRRSFATNFYIKIPTPLLMSATGHSTEKMFLEYIGKSSTEQAIELANYFFK